MAFGGGIHWRPSVHVSFLLIFWYVALLGLSLPPPTSVNFAVDIGFLID